MGRITIHADKQIMTSNTFLSGIMFIIIFILLRTLSQILIKLVALGPSGVNYYNLFFDPLFYLAGLVFFFQVLVWLFVLRRFALNFAYPFSSVTFITIMASGGLFFGESITLGNVLGSIVLMAGVVVLAGSRCK